MGYGVDLKTVDKKEDNLIIQNLRISHKLPFDDNFFDVVVMLAVLEHLENPVDIVREIHRVLKPYGKLVLTVPSKFAKPILEVLAYVFKVIDEEEIRDHKKYYNYKDLEDLVGGIDGMKIINHKYFQFGFNNFCVIQKL